MQINIHLSLTSHFKTFYQQIGQHHQFCDDFNNFSVVCCNPWFIKVSIRSDGYLGHLSLIILSVTSLSATAFISIIKSATCMIHRSNRITVILRTRHFHAKCGLLKIQCQFGQLTDLFEGLLINIFIPFYPSHRLPSGGGHPVCLSVMRLYVIDIHIPLD